MKNLTKIVSLACTASMALALAACAGNKPAEPAGTDQPVESVSVVDGTTEQPGADESAKIVIELGDAEGIEALAKQAQNFEIEEGTVAEINGLFSSGVSTPAIQEEKEDGSLIGLTMFIDGDFDAPEDKTEISVKGRFTKGAYYMEFHVNPEDIIVLEGQMPEEEPEMIAGGWTRAEDDAITGEAEDMFTKAVSDLVGAEYEPLKYMGSQIVNGTNHCFFAEITPVVPNPESHFAFVYIHEGLDGTAELINVHDLDIVNIDELEDIADSYSEYFDYEAAAEK